MHGRNDIDHPFREGIDDGPPVVFIAQGRFDLEEGSILAHVERIQCQMMDRGARCHIQPVVTGAAQNR